MFWTSKLFKWLEHLGQVNYNFKIVINIFDSCDQVVDMRWGVRDEATDDHMTTELCMREIMNCQRLSMGPNFVVSLGWHSYCAPFAGEIAQHANLSTNHPIISCSPHNSQLTTKPPQLALFYFIFTSTILLDGTFS